MLVQQAPPPGRSSQGDGERPGNSRVDVMPVAAESVANLTPFQAGNQAPRVSKYSYRALTKCRRMSPEMVDFLASVVRDATEPTSYRLKAAAIILDKALPGPRARNDDTGEPQSAMRFLEVLFVRPGETVTAEPSGGGAFAVTFGHADGE